MARAVLYVLIFAMAVTFSHEIPPPDVWSPREVTPRPEPGQEPGAGPRPSIDPRCQRPDEVFTVCGTACEPTCQNPKPKICTKQCRQGCLCRKGLFRRIDGVCVRARDCRP